MHVRSIPGFSGDQDKVPVIHPVNRLQHVINSNIFGGEAQLQDQLHSLSRSTRRSTRSRRSQNHRLCLQRVRRSAGANPSQCSAARHARHLHAGDRGSCKWRKSFTDPSPDLDAVRDPRADADRRLDFESAGRFEFPARRRHPERCA
jgi:hypothetical protein